MSPGKTTDFQYIITLVHGTWFPNAKWTRGGSPLRSILEQQLDGKQNIYFNSFQWRGDYGLPFNNSHRHRIQAGEKLKDNLNDLLAKYPRAKHYIIAHSHGGNVASYALRDATLRRRISGMICLGTPFITVTRRSISSTVSFLIVILMALMVPILPYALLIAFIAGLIGLLVFFAAPLYLLAFGSAHLFSATVAPLVWLSGYVAWIVSVAYGLTRGKIIERSERRLSFALIPLKKRSHVLAEQWRQKLTRMLENLTPPELTDLPLFCAVAKLDEAIIGLRGLGTFTNAFFQGWNGWIYIVIFLLCWQGMFFSEHNLALKELITWICNILPSLGMAAVLTCFTAVLHTLILAVVPIVRYAGFGAEPWVSSALANISIDRKPKGWGALHTMKAYPYSRHAFLNHSALCTNENTLIDIAIWIERGNSVFR